MSVWCRKFRDGRVDVHDESGQAHASLSQRQDLIEVNRVVLDNPRFTISPLKTQG